MENYLKQFDNTTEYESYIKDSPVLPNVSTIKNSDSVYYNPRNFVPAPREGVFLLYMDGSFYEWGLAPDEWDKSLIVGVLVSGEGYAFVIHPNAVMKEIVWSNNETVEINGITIHSENIDFNGKKNTTALLSAVEADLIDAPAAEYAANTVFINGKRGYLPSEGECKLIFENIRDINNSLNRIGGIEIPQGSFNYWTSTRSSSKYYAMIWSGKNDTISSSKINNTAIVIPITSL